MIKNNKKTKKKTSIHKKTLRRYHKCKRKGKNGEIRETNVKLLLLVAFFTAVLLIFSTYAWLSASLNVQIKFFDLVVSSDSGLFISLDGITFSDSVEVSLQSVITDLRATYPNHVNQWAAGGLWPVSSNGIRNANSDKFDIFIGEVRRYKGKDRPKKKYLSTILVEERNSNAANIFIAFDLFLKNVTASPYTDNVYLTEDTYIEFEEGISDDDREAMSGIMNSMRFGILKMSSTSAKSDIRTIQNLKCNNQCKAFIYEPYHLLHSDFSIAKALEEYNITLIDGVYSPTYAVIAEGEFLEHANGHEETGIPLDTEHFAFQQTINNDDFYKPLFAIPAGITKLRVYLWIEGQDIDSLETNSRGAAIYISLNFEKDLASYE